jgi:TPR repeat protein
MHFKRGALAGSKSSALVYAIRLIQGDGVTRDDSKLKVAKYLEMALGMDPKDSVDEPKQAEYLLGIMLMTGGNGRSGARLKRDVHRAAALLHEAAAAGNQKAAEAVRKYGPNRDEMDL